ncbi:MAG: hypothetical protein JKY19_07115 [Alcanivoracaceae bacterium]|nr:hypothetical protein [Alcanivoracaceae bacterium]
MIFITRSDPPLSLDLTKDTSAASKELTKAENHLILEGTPLPVKKFKAYSTIEVRDALKDLFHGKCAYCESQIAGSSQTDIEHYRPKGAVKEKKDHPGYWWLAMNWKNLVLSCMHCNQSRRQLILSSDLSEEEIRQAITNNDLQTTGKKSSFPTKDDKWIQDNHEDISTEKPLLIDPTVTKPEPLFKWKDNQHFAIVEAVNDNLKAQKTIEVLGLNRRWLCEQRMTKQIILSMITIDIREAIEDMRNASTDAVAQAFLTSIKRDINKLAALGDSRQTYAAMARNYLSKVKDMLSNAI